MNILAIETATEACSAAFWRDGEVLSRHRVAPRRHADLLLGDVRELLAEAGATLAGLDGIAFGRGPGSFTGVRIAASMAQGLALGADLPLAPVSTLAALAQGALRESSDRRVIATLDARMGEVYLGCYERGPDDRARALSAEIVRDPAVVELPDGDDWLAVGHGLSALDGVLAERLAGIAREAQPDRLPDARDVAELGAAVFEAGQGVPPEKAAPVYVRDRVAKKPGEK